MFFLHSYGYSLTGFCNCYFNFNLFAKNETKHSINKLKDSLDKQLLGISYRYCDNIIIINSSNYILKKKPSPCVVFVIEKKRKFLAYVKKKNQTNNESSNKKKHSETANLCQDSSVCVFLTFKGTILCFYCILFIFFVLFKRPLRKN